MHDATGPASTMMIPSGDDTTNNPHRRRLEQRTIYIYENERLWVGRGYTKKGLLPIPTERGPFSSLDGSINRKTIEDASLALLGAIDDVGAGGGGNVAIMMMCAAGGGRRRSLLPGGSNDDDVGGKDDASEKKTGRRSGSGSGRKSSSSRGLVVRNRGWSFHEEGGDHDDDDRGGFATCFGTDADGPTDVDGWQYFHDFSNQSLSSPNAKRGILDFVRRRKLRRVAFFRPDHFLTREVYAKCDFCDSKVVDMLSSAMLDALALAALFAHGTKNPVLSDAQALPLKFSLIDSLSIGKDNDRHRREDDEDDDEEEEGRMDPRSRIDDVKDSLCKFAETCVGGPGHLAHLFDPDVDRNLYAAMPRAREAMSRHFDERERACLARLVVRDVDRNSFAMHCRNECCGAPFVDDGDDDPRSPPCEFRTIACPNVGCVASFSFRHAAEHDAACPHTPCPCPNNCGTDVPRREVCAHVRDDCSLRQAECPLSMFGCKTIVRAQDVACHLNDHADEHFSLVAKRMMEYESVMKDMISRIRLLEEKNDRLERELRGVAASMQSKEHAKSLTNDVNKLTKRLGALEGTCQTEFKKIQNDRRNQRK